MKLSVETMARVTGAKVLWGRPPAKEADGVFVSRARIDSREVVPGCLFVCLPGERVDGHDYALAACERGASALLVQRPVEDALRAHPDVPQLVVEDGGKALGQLASHARGHFTGRVLGVTGSAGKTTLRQWLATSLGLAAKVAATQGNHNNQLGLPLSILDADGDEAFWVMEVGISHEGDMDELGSILRPDVAVVLNAALGHAEGLGAKGVAWHKARLFHHVTGTSSPAAGEAASTAASSTASASAVSASVSVFSSDATPLCVAPADDATLLREALAAAPKGTLRLFSAPAPEAPAVLPEEARPLVLSRGEVDAQCPSRCRVTLRGVSPEADGVHVFDSPLSGRAGAENCACVALVLGLLGLSPDLLARALSSVELPPHRNAHLAAGRHLVVDDTYNANPLSLARMLESAANEARSRGMVLGLVLGHMGELGPDEAGLHEEAGRLAAACGAAFLLWKGANARDVARGLGEGGAAPFFAELSSDEELEALLRTVFTDTMREKGLLLLCKGSRSNRLETAATALRDLLASPDFQP